MHGLLNVHCVRRDVHDNSAATHAPYVQHAGNTNARAQCIEILSVTDIHTYIPTQNEIISCLALRHLAIMCAPAVLMAVDYRIHLLRRYY